MSVETNQMAAVGKLDAVWESLATTLDERKRENSVDKLYVRYRSGETLQPGQLAKILHLLESNERETIQPQIAAAQAEYWKYWTAFRCGERGEGVPVFE